MWFCPDKESHSVLCVEWRMFVHTISISTDLHKAWTIIQTNWLRHHTCERFTRWLEGRFWWLVSVLLQSELVYHLSRIVEWGSEFKGMNICLGVHRGRCISGKFVFDLLPSQFFFWYCSFWGCFLFFCLSYCLSGRYWSVLFPCCNSTYIHPSSNLTDFPLQGPRVGLQPVWVVCRWERWGSSWMSR